MKNLPFFIFDDIEKTFILNEYYLFISMTGKVLNKIFI